MLAGLSRDLHKQAIKVQIDARTKDKLWPMSSEIAVFVPRATEHVNFFGFYLRTLRWDSLRRIVPDRSAGIAGNMGVEIT